MVLRLEQMARQLQQLQAQAKSLGGLLDDPGDAAFGRAAGVMDSLTRLQQTPDRWQSELPADPDPNTVTIDALPERTARSRAYLRERLKQAEAARSAVERDRDRVTVEGSANVEASNAAPGPKAARQAANQLQALVASEQAELQALQAMRGRLAALAAAVAATTPLVLTPPAHALFGVGAVVSDPGNFAQHLLILQKHAEELLRLQQQVAVMETMLQDRDFTRIDETLGQMRRIHQTLDAMSGSLGSLAGRFPDDWNDRVAEWSAKLREVMHASHLRSIQKLHDENHGPTGGR